MNKSISLMPMKGAIMPPTPYMRRFLRSNALAPIGLYSTPLRANGIRIGMIIALNMMAERIALSGLCRPMMLSAPS